MKDVVEDVIITIVSHTVNAGHLQIDETEDLSW